MKRRTALQALAASVAAPSFAQDRVLRIVVPFSAGGLHDLLTRHIAITMGRVLHRSVIVDNRAGAGGLVGVHAFQSADPANTLLMTYTGWVALPYSQKSATYDALKDFAPVAMFGNSPAFLIANGKLPVRDVAELIAYARTVPAGLEAATAGPGSWSDVWTRMLAKRAGIDIVRVPYKGLSEMTVALLGGDAKLMLTSFNDGFQAQAQAGRLRVLAVTSERSSPRLASVPPLAATLPGFVVDGWFGLVGSRALPPADLDAISASVKAAVADPATREKFASLYVEPLYEGPAEFAHSIAATNEQWRKVATELNLSPQ